MQNTYLRHGTLVLVGAAAATGPTPGMIAYGMAKASVHHLVKSAAEKDSGLPVGAKVVGLLPYAFESLSPQNHAGHAHES